ncbi:MAG: 4-alpha-glucanotransferase [Alphaproteobacteria bacterium]|nr:4-alpha-glucanotransferase [Alphaproteobacteria bacterium]MBV9695292.1 4-alpha-glucanotransferase [Alphaproteobacteria bacterium]
MSDAALSARARRAGLAREWTDAAGTARQVSDAVLDAVLRALGRDAEELADEEPAQSGARCWSIDDAAPERRLSALAVQLYSLRGSAGIGDLRALKDFALGAAACGIDAVAVSPLHAPLCAATGDASPYSPSSRLVLNPLYADVTLAGSQPASDCDEGDLVDWPRAAKQRLASLRSTFAAFAGSAGFDRFVAERGRRLLDHARFEALDAHFRKQDVMRWRHWPAAFRDPRSAAVEEFARAHEDEVRFHLFAQWLADTSVAEAQRAARESGSALGLICDIAVGMNPDGSHAWSARGEILNGLTIGAPPDVFNPQGQNWGLTALSPAGLMKTGFSGYIETLRAAMRHAGGVRIDHAMGLNRLWVIPEGGDPKDGVYLQYPLRRLLALLAQESRAHRAIVIGEDLGTVPDGFRRALRDCGALGMEVLWFQRAYEREGKPFLPAECWSRAAAALTTTHDLPTLSGWWCGRDIDWLERLARKSEHGDVASERWARGEDRSKLWAAIGNGAPEPTPQEPQIALAAALNFIARTACPLAVVPVEDVLGLVEQPNIPGTIDEHPNWRRRLPRGELFAREDLRRNLESLVQGRRTP